MYQGVEYTVRSILVRPGTHPVMPNAWSRWPQGYSEFEVLITHGRGRLDPPKGHYENWVLHIDGIVLPFKDAVRWSNAFRWSGVEFQELFIDIPHIRRLGGLGSKYEIVVSCQFFPHWLLQLYPIMGISGCS